MHDNVFFAKSGDNYVGMIILGLNYRQKLKHIADIFGVYVDPKYRGFGIGQKLLDHVIQKAKSYSIIRKMKLEVVSTQIPAINLYTKNGFHKVGVLKDELHDQNQYFDTLIMEKYL
jgi:ribosomal protein S18 acetylase RimI-like enzyme